MMRALEVPQQFSGVGIQCQQAIGVQIIADPVITIEIAHRRTGGRQQDAALFIQHRARPGIGATARFPKIRRPAVVVDT